MLYIKMPYKFSFSGHTTDFQCPVACFRCMGTTKTGSRCSKRTCIGSPFCWIHLLSEKKLRIKDSTIPNAGKGVFVQDASKRPNAVVFKAGAEIVDYFGEMIGKTQLEERYGERGVAHDDTGPYAAVISEVEPGLYEDAACQRGAGAIVNQARRFASNNVRFKVKRPQNGKKYITIAATKDIKNNKELFLWYGENYRMNEPGVSYRTK